VAAVAADVIDPLIEGAVPAYWEEKLMQIQNQAMLRFHLSQADGAELAPERAPSNFRILIVNEDMRSADSLKRTLNDLGYATTFTAYSARRALDIAMDLLPAVALLDLELPDMTGYQLAHKFRSHRSESMRRVPLLAIAELPMFGNAELTRAAGFIGCLAKPVPSADLNALLNKLHTGAWS
jgi:CheY-like chemotaxis protein